MPRAEWVNNDPPKVTNKVSVKPTIHNVFLLDTSPSMKEYGNDKFTPATQALTSQIEELRKDDSVNYTFSIFQFSDSYYLMKFIYLKQDGGVIPKFYKPTNGMTGLNDAIGEAITTFMNDVSIGSDQVVFKIFTDGGENKSREYTTTQVAKLIKEIQDKNNWVVTFLGTETDTNTAIRLYSVDKSNTVVHNNTAEDVKRVITYDTVSTQHYAKRIVQGDTSNKDFY